MVKNQRSRLNIGCSNVMFGRTVTHPDARRYAAYSIEYHRFSMSVTRQAVRRHEITRMATGTGGCATFQASMVRGSARRRRGSRKNVYGVKAWHAARRKVRQVAREGRQCCVTSSCHERQQCGVCARRRAKGSVAVAGAGAKKVAASWYSGRWKACVCNASPPLLRVASGACLGPDPLSSGKRKFSQREFRGM